VTAMFVMTAPTRKIVPKRRTCFWNARWVFCRAVELMTTADRKRALAAPR